jgi:hypothetical protein
MASQILMWVQQFFMAAYGEEQWGLRASRVYSTASVQYATWRMLLGAVLSDVLCQSAMLGHMDRPEGVSYVILVLSAGSPHHAVCDGR